MNDNESEVTVSTKKKADKTQPAESNNLVVTVDKKAEKSDGDESKPRIVLTFRSEKFGTKSSNMKIVSNEDKTEEFSPRRSNRTRNSKWEWGEEQDTISPKKDKSVSQSVSENDEASDSSHTTPKRSTRRRSKDSSDVLANAIARKEKSYNETAGPTQRLSRRIKPTAKVLENEELRIGLESQNNARLGLQTEKQDEGVRTRRSAKSIVSGNLQDLEKKDKRSKTEKMEIEDTNDKEEDQISVMKLKHLCELGLQAINPESVDDEAEVDNQDEDNEVEGLEDGEEEIDDDSEVISKLLEADEDSASESSDEEFYCSAEASETERPRRSNRLSSTYGANDSDRSSPVGHGEAPRRRSSRRTTKHYIEDSDRSYKPKRKKNRPTRGLEPASEPEQEETSNPAGGDEGSEAACPEEDSTVVATCLCEKASNIYAAPEDLIEPVFCQAIEVVEGVRAGCSRAARRVGGALAALVRAGPRAPYVLACDAHAAQMRAHMCCPACGLYCTQGIFYQCSQGHLFHLECGLPYNDSKVRTGCPHCGVLSYRWQPVNHDCVKVRVQMHSSNKTIFLPDQREQCTPAYLSFSTQDSLKVDEEPLIPEDLLPSNLEDLKRLCEKPEGADYEQLFSGSPAQVLYDAIVAGEAVEQLIPKIAVCGHVDEQLGAGETCAHAAARAGRAAALALLRAAGARLDAADAAGCTPLLVAVKELVEKSNKDTKTPKEIDNESPEMEIERDKEEIKEDNDEDKTIQETERKEGEKESEIVKATDEDLLKVIKYLIAAGCDVNFPGPERMTALHICAQYGGEAGLAATRALLAAPGLLVDARDLGGWTPLVWAAEHARPEIIKVLLSAGADAATKDAEGNGAIHWCALGGGGDALLQLLAAAPHLRDATNAHEDTPLHVAARQGHFACVMILLARGARTDIVNSAGELAVQVCTGRCRAAIALSMHMRGNDLPPRVLHNDISLGREYHPVPCVNEVDDEPLPDFKYVTRHVMPHNVTVDYSLPTMQGCECAGGPGAWCGAGACACVSLGVRAWYDARGRLAAGFPYHDPPMLFECNQTCACDVRQCGNNVVTKLMERGSLGVRVEVFRIGGARGWGLRARQHVPRGTAVAIYCGELLPLPEADTRSADHYMFALDVKPDLLEQCADASALCVDALRYGAAARFVNHSCRPSLAPVRVYAATRDLRLPAVALFAVADLRAGDELTFDYGDKFWDVKSKWMKCECGAPDCRYPEKSSEDSEA